MDRPGNQDQEQGQPQGQGGRPGGGQPGKNEDQAARMGEDSITSLMIRFSLPATLAMAVNASYSIVDTMFVGRLGGQAIAALSVSFPVQMILGAFGIGAGVGGASLLSRSLGAGKKGDAVLVVGQVIMLALAMGLLIALVGFFFLEPMMGVFGATPEIMDLTLDYMGIITGGAGLLFLVLMLNHAIRAEGNPILPMKVLIVTALVNIALDPLFIFVLDMGIRGAAVATVLAKVLGVIMLFWYYLAGRSSLRVRMVHLVPNGRIVVEIFRVGLPMFLIQVSNNLAMIAANRVLGSYGYVTIAVMGLMMRLQMFAFMPVIGIAQGVLPIIGYNFGAGKYLRIRETMYKGAGVSTLLVSLAALSFYAFPGFFLGLFSSEPELLEMGKESIRIMVLMYPLLGPQTMSVIFFQAIGKGIPSLWLSLLRQFILYVPFVLWLPGLLGLRGIWLATPLADLLAFVVTITRVSLEFKRQGIPLGLEAES